MDHNPRLRFGLNRWHFGGSPADVWTTLREIDGPHLDRLPTAMVPDYFHSEAATARAPPQPMLLTFSPSHVFTSPPSRVFTFSPSRFSTFPLFHLPAFPPSHLPTFSLSHFPSFTPPPFAAEPAASSINSSFTEVLNVCVMAGIAAAPSPAPSLGEILMVIFCVWRSRTTSPRV